MRSGALIDDTREGMAKARSSIAAVRASMTGQALMTDEAIAAAILEELAG